MKEEGLATAQSRGPQNEFFFSPQDQSDYRPHALPILQIFPHKCLFWIHGMINLTSKCAGLRVHTGIAEDAPATRRFPPW